MGAFDRRLLAAILLICGLGVSVAQAADMTIVDLDGSGEGLNDGTAVEPVGGNEGQTLGEQRRIALKYAADILGSRIASTVPIRIATRFDDLVCSANRATLGRASPAQFAASFAGQHRPDTFYPVALANALSGRRVQGAPNDITMTFNSALDSGDSDCLQGNRWYYGLDNDRPAGRISFLSTAVHELIHGLGFVSLVALHDSSGSSVGQFPVADNGNRLPDIYSSFIKDLAIAGQPRWPDLSDAQRADSVTHGPDVVWGDSTTANAAAGLLTDGLNQGYVQLYAPSAISEGSSISHWDTGLSPDQIMEPFVTGKDDVTRGIGLASCVLENIGWQLINDTRCPDVRSATIAGDERAIDTTVEPAMDNQSAPSGDSSSGGGGGGCTLDPEARFDPLWLVLLMAGVPLIWRRRMRRV